MLSLPVFCNPPPLIVTGEREQQWRPMPFSLNCLVLVYRRTRRLFHRHLLSLCLPALSEFPPFLRLVPLFADESTAKPTPLLSHQPRVMSMEKVKSTCFDS